ncbi:Sulfate transporter 3.1 [Hibiscus syriacus]|uniref:Sulfate transporter 3.1 n=1 Tax=Hibiscus syriacus TaxID=106335 RepID=A0A6A3BSA9_HIBSY|nr:Sulfate transporter 3.1 [Hibiscus syriacus]
MGSAGDYESQRRVPVPPSKPFLRSLRTNLKETFFPDDPFKQFKNQPVPRKLLLLLHYFVPILEWAPRYTFDFFKADLIAVSPLLALLFLRDKLCKLGYHSTHYRTLFKLCSSTGICHVGELQRLAVGTVAVASLLIFNAWEGVGFMGGAATIVCLQQLKGILGLVHFTHETDLVSVMRSVFSQIHQWRWESAVLGCCFLSFLLLTRYFSKRKAAFFWINAMAPLTSVILGSLLVYLTHAEKHGVQVIGHLKKGLIHRLQPTWRSSPPLDGGSETGIIIGIIGLAWEETFAMFKNYHIDGPFSRTAVNFNAGSRSAVSNIVMATAVMFTLLFLTPLFHYTPLVVLSSIIIAAMLGLLDYEAAIHLWKIDKFDFFISWGHI